MTRKTIEDLAPPTMSEHDGVRYLHLGTPWVQGAMRTKTPNKIELEYVQRMMACLLLRPQDELTEGHAVQLGLGAGAITRFTRNMMKMRSTVVELNPDVIAICRAYFKLGTDNGQLRVEQADAGEWAADAGRAGTVDLLSVDLYDEEAAGPVIDSEAFYRDCHALLAEGGVFAVNLFGRHASFALSAARIAAAFGADHVASLQPTKEGNTVVIAAKNVSMPDRETLAARAQAIEDRLALPAKKWLRMIRPLPGGEQSAP